MTLRRFVRVTIGGVDVRAAVVDLFHNAQQRTRTDACQKYDHVKLACEKSRSKG